MVVRDGEKALVGWATTKSGDSAPATVVDGSQTSHSMQLAVRTEMRTNPTLGFRALLTQHPLASAACLLLQRGGYRNSGHSRPSISREPTPYFRRSRARQEWCGTKRTYAHAAIADAASVSGRGMACVAAQKFRTSGH